MSLLLRYVSRTNSDYKAFTSFLKLKNGNSTLKIEHLEHVINGISNITQDFENQAIIADSMLEHKFDKILEGLTDDQQIEEIEQFAEKELDNQLKRQKEINIEDKVSLTAVYNKKIRQIILEKDNALMQEKLAIEIAGLEKLNTEKSDRLIEKESSKFIMFKQKLRLDKKATNRSKFTIGLNLLITIVYFTTLVFLINEYDFVAKYWGLLSVGYIILNYLYILLNGKTISIKRYFSKLQANYELKLYAEYGFDNEIYQKFNSDIKDLKAEIKEIQSTKKMATVNKGLDS